MKRLFVKAILITLVWATALDSKAQDAPQLGKNSVDEVIRAMTLQEKVDILVGGGMYVPGMPMPGASSTPSDAQKRVTGAAGTTGAIPRLGIPGMVVCDGPAGIHAFNGGKSRMYYATAWPIGSLLASSWDTALVNKVGSAYGREAKEYGIDIILGPGMNIHRNPLGARNFEYFSEDPILTGHIAAAVVNGIQSNGVGVSAKHFFANNQETNRSSVNTIISERAMREIYLKPWQIMVQQSNPWTIMSSYNLVNGPYTSENKELLRTILRDEWKFNGFVMTDWFGGIDVIAQQQAGNNLIMPGLPTQKQAIIDAVKSGKLDEKILDQNCKEILNIVLLSPAFKGYKYSDNPPLKDNAQLSRVAAAESMILLKNEKNALPLDLNKKIAIFGNNQLDLVAGGTGSGDVNKMYVVHLADGLFHAGFAIQADLYRTYASYMQSENAKKPKRSLMEELMSPPIPITEMDINQSLIDKAALESEVAIIAIGRNAGEGNDRKVEGDYYLTTKERTLITNVSKAFRKQGKKIILTLNIGGVVDVVQWRDEVDAVLLAWQPGLEGGHAMADVLSGKVNPSGKLATTFPAKYEDEISAPNFPGKEIPGSEKPGLFGQSQKDAEVIYEEGVFVGYRYYSSFGVKTAYPFGHGLSYSAFEYSSLNIDKTVMAQSLNVTVTVTNTGELPGKEVVQLYLNAPSSKMDKPLRELKAFAKTKELLPGASEEISFVLNVADLASFDTKSSTWLAEAGIYTLSTGDAENSKAKISFKLPNEVVIEKVNKAVLPQVKISELMKATLDKKP